MPYQFLNLEDVTDCRNFLLGGPPWDQNLSKRDDPEGVGKKKLRDRDTRDKTIEELAEIIQMDLGHTREQNREIWDKFIERMTRPRISERETRSRYPWGIWRTIRSGEILGAPALFGGVVLREDEGFYQIHQYPNPDV